MLKNITVYDIDYPSYEGYSLTNQEISRIEKISNCKYVGYFYKRDEQGNILNNHVYDVFYSTSDNNYFGIYVDNYGKLSRENMDNTFISPFQGYVDLYTNNVFIVRKVDTHSKDPLKKPIIVKVIAGNIIPLCENSYA